jgi:hypothetical protein
LTAGNTGFRYKKLKSFALTDPGGRRADALMDRKYLRIISLFYTLCQHQL